MRGRSDAGRAGPLAVLAVVNAVVLVAGAAAAVAHPARVARAAHVPRPASSTSPRPRTSTTPAPRRTIIVAPRTVFRAGETAVVTDRASGAAVALTAMAPTVSRGALGSYGYGPQHGYYVTFAMTVINRGNVPVLLNVTDFVVIAPAASPTTVEDGNSPYSGSPNQLDNSVIAPGERDHGLLTFDLAVTHGALQWRSAGRVACSWRF